MGRVGKWTKRLVVAVAVASMALALLPATASAAPTDEEVLQAALLTQADAPAGWVEAGGAPAGLAPGIDACKALYKADAKAQKTAEIDQSQVFADPAAPQVSNVSNSVYVFPSAKKAKKYVKAFTKAADTPDCISGQAEAAISTQVPEGAEVTADVSDATSVDLGDQGVRFDAEFTVTLNGTPLITAGGAYVVIRIGRTVVEFQVFSPSLPIDQAVEDAIAAVVARVDAL